ncbi:MAG: hypothetical protein ACOCT9_00020 [archaeon]
MDRKIKTFKTLDKIPGPVGFLRVWGKRKDGLIKQFNSGQNVILDIYRENLASFAVDIEVNSYAESIIPENILFDNQGSEKLEDETENILTPEPEDRIDEDDENFYEHEISSKGIGEENNIITCTTKIELSEANGLTFSRAMLTAMDDEPIALKCFEAIDKKSTWELFFDWSIAY